jgi:hypothetical protein
LGSTHTIARPIRVQANEGRSRGGQAALSRHARGSVSFNTVGPAATAESRLQPCISYEARGLEGAGRLPCLWPNALSGQVPAIRNHHPLSVRWKRERVEARCHQQDVTVTVRDQARQDAAWRNLYLALHDVDLSASLGCVCDVICECDCCTPARCWPPSRPQPFAGRV